MPKFNVMLNLITSLLIFLIGSIAISSEKYISPRSINIENIKYLMNTKTNSPKSRNSLLIYTNNVIIYRSSCLGLEQFCSKGQEILFERPVHIKYLLVQDKARPEGIILEIVDSMNHGVIFRNDSNSIKSYLNGVRNIKFMCYGISVISLYYLIIYAVKLIKI